MTTTYAPNHPLYLDEADVRGELTRVFDVCGSCRSCVDLCASFPTLFDMLDQQAQHTRHGHHIGTDAGRLTPAEQDRVVGQCVQCNACSAACPYVPGLHAWAVDVPRLMLRTKAMQHRAGLRSMRSRLVGQFAGRPKLVAKLAVLLPGTAARIAGASFARPRFSTWFGNRTSVASSVSTADRRGAVTVFPTCRVEYHEPTIGIDLVERYEANGIGCTLSGAVCCGAPWLFSGDIERFTKIAAENVATLSAEIGRGADIVVSEASCRHVVCSDYVDHVGGADADLVATHTFEPSELLARCQVERPDEIRPDRPT